MPWPDDDTTSTTNTWVKVWRPEYNQYWYYDRVTKQYMQPAGPVEATLPEAPKSPIISTTVPYLPRYNPDASITGYEWLENPNYVPPASATKTDQWQDPMDGSIWIIDSQGDKLKQLSPAIPGWAPGLGVRAPQQAPQRAPRYPEEIEEARLRNEQLRRDLTNPLLLGQQQLNEAISLIQGQIAAGELDPAEGERQLGLARAHLSAALQGTTPWQMEQAKRDASQQQANLAQRLLADQLGTGASMAQGLLSGLGGIYGNILQSSKPPVNFNPLEMAKAFTGDVGGGQEMNQLARNVLLGALRGGL